MGMKQRSEKFFKGWFPQEPTLRITRNTSTKFEEKSGNWALCPFIVPGALIIFAAFLSAFFGLTFVSWYLPDSTVISTMFYIGIFSVAGFVLDLICGVLLLAGKRIHVAAAGLAVILCLGFATIATPILMGLKSWTGSLLVALPLIAFPAVALIQTGLNSRKLKAISVIHEPDPAVETEPQPINRKPVAAGLAAAGCGFILAGLWSYYLAPIWAKMVPGIVIVAGAGLIAAAYLERRTYKHRGLSDGNEK
jgi:hypothetical protein